MKTYQIDIDEKLFSELRMAIDEGIAELDKGEGITHENVLHELQAKYP